MKPVNGIMPVINEMQKEEILSTGMVEQLKMAVAAQDPS